MINHLYRESIAMDANFYIEPHSISGHLGFLKEGNAYLKTVTNAHKRPEVFSPEIVFNLLSMSIEKLMMSILMYSGCLPDNHTFFDLANAYHAVDVLEPEMKDLLLSLDSHNNLCSMDAFHQTIPNPETLHTFLELARKFQGIAMSRMGDALAADPTAKV
jgi:hypothetical protein